MYMNANVKLEYYRTISSDDDRDEIRLSVL